MKTRLAIIQNEIKITIGKIDKIRFLRTSEKLDPELVTATYHYEEKLLDDLHNLQKLESKEMGLV